VWFPSAVRVLYVDIDTLRPDHLGCYGYHRDTSPTIDALAADGVRFTNLYASDTPCLPSRSALISGRFGIRNGAVGHGGTAADPFAEGPRRGFTTRFAANAWTTALRRAGLVTASVSTFAERHSAYHFAAGFNEVYNLGTAGLETADQVGAVADDWLVRHGARDDWFLHVHFWDPHTPYRTPAEVGEPFADSPPPAWLDEEVRAAHWALPGPHSAQEIAGFGLRRVWDRYPRQPQQAGALAAVRRIFDGYDTGVLFADRHLGRLLDRLADLGVEDETAVIVSSDHGENLGELGVYCDHQTADQLTARLPAVVRWPGRGPRGRVDDGLYYQVDLAATVIELVGGEVPDDWDGRSFAAPFDQGRPAGRDHLVLSHGAWTVQRSVRFDQWLCIRTYHDGFHWFPDVLLFDVEDDPHEQSDLSAQRPDVVGRAAGLLGAWRDDALSRSDSAADPLWTVIREGGPWHTLGRLDDYLGVLRSTGRAAWADRVAARHRDRRPSPDDAGVG
jgi:arylsulfatase A-like enzyme